MYFVQDAYKTLYIHSLLVISHYKRILCVSLVCVMVNVTLIHNLEYMCDQDTNFRKLVICIYKYPSTNFC